MANKEMITNKPRQRNRRNNNNKTSRKWTININMCSKRKSNDKYKEGKTINHRKKEYRKQCGNQLQHSTEKKNLDMQEPNNDEGMSTQRVQNRSKVDHNKKI
ncbi:hypothetical protein H5410_027642 [Solanum commersonii]|uniref:Uncharacterized protein n=1 Tax=Solanum commersonii TaxID=4109 RepID=A0A9J5Z521_SOLCO|nr:hypothetical protein H5410_027642 [Solanum commersonii]